MTSLPSRPQSKVLAVFCLLIIWLGFGIRLHNLGHDSFWFDEALTVIAARAGIQSAMSQVHHPPLHYVFVLATMKLFGENEFAARLSSVFVGTLTLPLLMMWGRRIGRLQVGLWAAFLLALSPFHLRYSQEARHYAWLTFFSLAAYIFLYLAGERRQWRWWIFFSLATVLNLYTHFAALVVLASQAILLAGWVGVQWRRLGYRALVYPSVSALLVFILYIPGIPRLLFALTYNLGGNAIRGGENIDVASAWIRKGFFEIGTSSAILPYVLAVLALIGFLVLIRSGHWLLALIVGGIVLPIFLISVFKVARWSLAKYIIYILPLYLFAIGIALDRVLEWSKGVLAENGRYAYAVGSLFIILFFSVLSWPLLQHEYDYIERDWKGLVAYLHEQGQTHDIILTTTLDQPTGFDAGILMVPYYEARTDATQTVLSVHQLRQDELAKLAQTNGNVWLVVMNATTQTVLTDDAIEIIPFQGSLYLLNLAQSSSTVIDQLIHGLEQVRPLVVQIVPDCYLGQDLALLYAQKQDYAIASDLFAEVKARCQQEVDNTYGGSDLLGTIYRGLIDDYQAQDDIEAARQIARQLLLLSAKDTKALATLTAVDLMQSFTAGKAQTSEAAGVEPVEIRRFTMPQNGDWGDVLFIHPPNAVAYDVQLPDEAVELRFRAAMAPESWQWGGDGATFVVSVTTVNAMVTELWRQHIGNDAAAQKWHEFAIPLSDYAGQAITLNLVVEPGPVGDATGDWAGWETPRIMYAAVP